MKFNKEYLEFFLPENFKGLSKNYILECIFDPQIQSKWKPKVGDIIVGSTGNVFVISGYHSFHSDLGGDLFFFGGGLCSRDGGGMLNSTCCYCMNQSGQEYGWVNGKPKKVKKNNYSSFSDFRYVPYPHEI